VRARQRIRELQLPFEIPSGEELGPRLQSVLQTLYLLFNEGYKASSGESLIREELCREAIRLAEALAEHPAGNQPRTHALLALMLLNASHIPSRIDESGNLLRLQEQDRTRWDQKMIARGMFHFSQSAAGEELSDYHLQAGIAACHAAAKDYESTDWKRILVLYDRLIELDGSPIIALNRAIVIANLRGPDAGLEAIKSIKDLGKLDSYYLLHAVLGEFQTRRKQFKAAAAHYRDSLKLVEIQSERTFLSNRLQSCEAQSAKNN